MNSSPPPRPELVLDARAELAESPVWDPVTGVLWWVDILPGLVHRFDPATGGSRSVGVGQPVGCVALARDGGLLAAVRDGFALLRPTGELVLLAEVEVDDLTARMNDGAVDARGRFWAGTTRADRAPGSGTLYRLGPPGTATAMVAGATLPNGIDWSPDGRTMYFIDSATNRVDRFEFDPVRGTLGERSTVVGIPADLGMPDGLTVDASGCLWVALYRGGAVHRYTPAGELDRVLELPVRLVTSVAFGDSDLGTLYVTTATRGLQGPALREQPGAGGIFALRPGVTGLPANRSDLW